MNVPPNGSADAAVGEGVRQALLATGAPLYAWQQVPDNVGLAWLVTIWFTPPDDVLTRGLDLFRGVRDATASTGR